MRAVFRPRWVFLHVVVVMVVGLFTVAGVWQLQRLDERRERNAIVEARAALPVVDIEEALAKPGNHEHRRVRAVGTYDMNEQVVVRQRSLDGSAGDHLVTPLVLDAGRAVLVNRGWVPAGLEDRTVAAPPEGEVAVIGNLRHSEGKRPLATDDTSGPEVGRIDVASLATQLTYPIFDLYLVLEEQTPPGADLPRPAEPIELSDGPHLVYAVQWFLFVLVSVVGYAALLRKEIQKSARGASVVARASASDSVRP